MQPKRRNGTSASKRGDTKQVSAHAPGSTAVFPTAVAAASSLIQPLPNADGHNGHQLTPGSMAGRRNAAGSVQREIFGIQRRHP
ncbi:MAG: hypothetical protein BHV63_09340 [Alistipes sp. 56_11]|nr:MAG: hypothetical protein BHV63_09340 [Alistipes sp. 56_11]